MENDITLNAYQEKAMKTAIYSQEYGLFYSTMGLAGEAGEVANKVKKLMRDSSPKQIRLMTDEDRLSIIGELGDCLWYVAAVAKDLGVQLESVAIHNLEKLKSRSERGAIKGSGDNR